MNVDVNGLRQNLVDGYNELSQFLEKGRVGHVTRVDTARLSRLMQSLHNNTVLIAGLQLPGVMDSIIDDDFEIIPFAQDDDEEDDDDDY